MLVESPIIVLLSVCIKVSCTYFVTPSYTIQLIAILAGDVSNAEHSSNILQLVKTWLSLSAYGGWFVIYFLFKFNEINV